MKLLHRSLTLVLLIFLIYRLGYAEELKTEHISIGEGLSNVNSNVIIQDKFGFLWIGTNDGLNRYDGYEFKVYKNVPGNSSTLINNEIWDIAEDKKGNLWIATRDGVSYFDRLQNKFRNYDLDSLTIGKPEQFPKSISAHVDKNGQVWIGSIWGGILKYNPEINEFVKIYVNADEPVQFGAAYRMAENKNHLFANHFGYGLVEYNPELDSFDIVEYSNEGEQLSVNSPLDRISKLYIDHSNTLWIVTDGSIKKMDIETKILRTVVDFKTNNVFDVWKLFTGLTQDTEGNVWIGKDLRGIYKFDGISDDYTFIPFGTEYVNNPYTYSENVRSIYTDYTGIMWFGTAANGLFKYDPAAEPFILYKHNKTDPTSISGDQIFGLAESDFYDGRIYVGTRGAGINIFDKRTEKFKKINMNFENDAFGGSIRAVLENEDGSAYFGSWGDGLFLYSDKAGPKLVSKFDPNNNSTLPHSSVRVLTKDNTGKIWVGTLGGLAIYDPVYEKVKRIYTRPNSRYSQDLLNIVKKNYSERKIVKSILQVGDDVDSTESFSIDRPRDYLVVSVGEGLTDEQNLVDYGWIENDKGEVIWTAEPVADSKLLGGANKNRIKISLIRLNAGNYNLRYISDDSHSYSKWNAEAPADSTLWGIQIMNITAEEYETIRRILAEDNNNFYVSGQNIWSVVVSKSNSNIIWIGYDNEGFDKFNKNSNSITNYQYNSNDPNSLNDNSIRYIHEDSNGILWIATDAGLNKFDPITEQFTHFTEEDGLPTNYIASILEDDFGNMWIATRNGISRMTFSDGRATFVNYDSKDGLGGVDFIASVAMKTSDGNLYFGGEHGLNVIEPGSINQNPPELLLTDLKISNQSVMHLENSPIQNSIYETDRITLTHDQNDLSFEFAALHFARAEKNQYAHILEGYDEDWTYDNRKFATYTNLDPGEYRFIFRGSNSEGVWNDEGKSIEIEILPPWWATTWAYVGYGFLFVAFIFGIDRFQKRRLLAKIRERRKLEEAETRAENAELHAKAAEAERRALEAEYIHKKKELEEARALQLSMLPEKLPDLPNLDIAVYMNTATEVGGDYYDFHVALDGTLTVVLGDATGHGMKAGTMVTAVKGLFNSYSANPDILYSFQEISRCIKQMRLGKLSMCMTMLKINKDKMIMSAAGMPPIMIYKSEDQFASEEVIKGMPLGTFDNYPYEIRETKLKTGDTILLMSDGLPELQNNEGELYGYQRIRNLFENNASKTPEYIIDQLKSEGKSWSSNKEPDDDITFVVIKVK